jgi:DHA3 family macrolide efflux protein-like MFS transporter
MVLGGLILGIWGGSTRRIRTAMLALLFLGLTITIIGLTPPTAFILAIGAFFFIGLLNSMANASFLAILQTTVSSEMQGRIFTLTMSGSMAMSPLGLAIAGPIADYFGVQIWFLFTGIVMTIIGLSAFFIPTLMNVEDQKPP